MTGLLGCNSRFARARVLAILCGGELGRRKATDQ
jgi:hypothetical protein